MLLVQTINKSTCFFHFLVKMAMIKNQRVSPLFNFFSIGHVIFVADFCYNFPFRIYLTLCKTITLNFKHL